MATPAVGSIPDFLRRRGLSDESAAHRGPPYVGFYWTLPIPAVGFVNIPTEVEASAKVSRTIRYQRERIQRWVADERGHLAAEFSFMELRPDRGSPEISETFEKAIRNTKKLRAKLVYVSFWDYHNARLHRHLRSLIQDHAELCIPLPPEPAMVDGLIFDPIDHFRRTRTTVPRAWSDEHRAETLSAVAFAVAAAGSERGSAARVASTLNGRGVETLNGRAWTAENVRAFLRKL